MEGSKGSPELPQEGGSQPLHPLDTALSCTICYSMFDTPLLLKSCGHSFCSACIRQNLEFQERNGPASCPSCRKPCDARDLTANISLRGAVEKYRAVRPLMLQLWQDSLSRQQQQQQDVEAGQAGKPDRTDKHAAPSPAEDCEPAKQWQPRAGSQRKLRPRQQRQVQPPSTRTRAAGAAKPAAAGGRAGKQQRARKRRRGGSTGCGEQGSDDDFQSSSSGSEFVVEVGGSSEEEAEQAPASQEVEAISLLDSDSAGSGSGLSDAESLSPPAKRARRQAEQQGQRGRRATTQPQKQQAGGKQQEQPSHRLPGEEGMASVDGAAAAPPDTPAGFVRCPICAKTVPEFYINSHVDSCLAGGGGAVPGPSSQKQQQTQAQKPVQKPAAGRGATHLSQEAPGSRLAGPRQQPPQQMAPKPFVPLAVPAKLVPNLASEKSLRGFLAKYGLPTEGKKKDMMERYNRMRLAVEMANDRGEATSYRRLASRVMQEERFKAGGASSAMAGALLRRQQAAPAPAPAGGTRSGGGGEGTAAGDVLPETGHTFKALTAALRARMAAKKAAAAAAAGEAAVGGLPQQQALVQQQEQRQEDGGSPSTSLLQREGPGEWATAGQGASAGSSHVHRHPDAECGASPEQQAPQPLPDSPISDCHAQQGPGGTGDVPLPPQQAQHDNAWQALPSALSMLCHQGTPADSTPLPAQQGAEACTQAVAAPAPAPEGNPVCHPAYPPQQLHWVGEPLQEQMPPNSRQGNLRQLQLGQAACQAGSHAVPAQQAPAMPPSHGACRLEVRAPPGQQQQVPAQQEACQAMGSGGLNPVLNVLSAYVDYCVADSDDDWD